MIIKEKKKKFQINVIISSFFNFNKYKHIKKTFFNAFALKKNNYLKINVIFFAKFD